MNVCIKTVIDYWGKLGMYSYVVIYLVFLHISGTSGANSTYSDTNVGRAHVTFDDLDSSNQDVQVSYEVDQSTTNNISKEYLNYTDTNVTNKGQDGQNKDVRFGNEEEKTNIHKTSIDLLNNTYNIASNGPDTSNHTANANNEVDNSSLHRTSIEFVNDTKAITPNNVNNSNQTFYFTGESQRSKVHNASIEYRNQTGKNTTYGEGSNQTGNDTNEGQNLGIHTTSEEYIDITNTSDTNNNTDGFNPNDDKPKVQDASVESNSKTDANVTKGYLDRTAHVHPKIDQPNVQNTSVEDTNKTDDNITHGKSEITETAEEEVKLEMYDKIRLPQSLKPRLYNITLQTFDDSVDPKDFWFSCETVIYLDCIESTDRILLHSLGHNITFMSLQNSTGPSLEITEWWSNSGIQMLMIKPSYTMVQGDKYTLTIRSVSSMSESLRGFYYSPYQEGNVTKYVHTTMMEPTDARQVFPCFDEPDFKAVFIFNIKRKAHHTSLTNLPKRTTYGPDEDGFYTDVFDEPRTVPMSSYLVAVAIGELGHLTSDVNNVTFRTWCRHKEVNKTRYALEIGIEFMKFFEEYFQIPYSLPKEDMFAVPTMSFSGMEHWGLITYRESMLFYEEGVTSLEEKELMTIIIAHEVAHQWFGNLVSPYWWDDLWLNEGFATYMMFLGVDRVIPSWNMANKLISDTRGVHNVMTADDDMNTHPVYVAVDNPDDINRIFDLISYAKGGAVIRMMNFFLGEDTFRRGLTRYLLDFSYKTATHNDLWMSLSKQAVVDNHTYTDVKAVMDSWVLEENYPVVMVTRVNSTTIKITQSAFLETEKQRLARSEVLWKIPFVFTTDIDCDFEKTFEDIVWLTDKSMYISDDRLVNAAWIIGNIQQHGFYRVNYEEGNWNALLDQLASDHTVIHTINRAQIINDAWNLARAGMLDMKLALRTLNYLDAELDFVPWKTALRELESVKQALQLTPLFGHFQKFMRTTLEKAYFSTAGASDHYEKLQFSMVAKSACEAGLKVCINDVMEMFTAWKEDDNYRVDPDMKEVVYCIGVGEGGEDEWRFVLQRFKESESPSERNALLVALACTREPWLLATLADIVFHTKVFSKTEKVTVMVQLSSTPVGRLLAWNIMAENWDKITGEFSEDLNMFTGIINAITQPYNSLAELNKIKAFIMKRRDNAPALGVFLRAMHNTSSKMDWLKIHIDTLKEWLEI